MFGAGRFAESSLAEIEIPEWGHTAFRAMLEWLYTGCIPRELSSAHLTELLGLADHYTLDGLKHVCENVLVHSVEVENACTLLRHADRFMAAELKRYCLAYIMKNFDQVAYTQNFDELGSQPALLLEVTRAAATKNKLGNLSQSASGGPSDAAPGEGFVGSSGGL